MVLLLGCSLAACASHSAPLPVSQPDTPGPMSMSRAEVDARVADHRLMPARLERIGSREEISVIGGEPQPQPQPGTFFTSECVPGGAGDVVYRDEQGWLYVVDLPATGAQPPSPGGVSVATPSTRCFRDTWAIPPTLRLAGAIQIK
jgi:hypothetical protein